MNWKANLIIAILALFTLGCSSGNTGDDHGHEHGTDTHMHEGTEHSHEDDNGGVHQKQEEFTVGEDSTIMEDHHDHEHEDGHDHQH